MKIGFVTRELPPSRRVGGIGNYVWDTARYIADLGHQVVIIAASDNVAHNSDTVVEGVRVIRLSGADFYLGNGNRLVVALRSHVRRLFCYVQYRRMVADCLNKQILDGGVEIVEFAEYGNNRSAIAWVNTTRSCNWGSDLLD